MTAVAHLTRRLAPATAVALLTLAAFGATSAVHHAGTADAAGVELTTGITTTAVHVDATMVAGDNNGWD
ncbi:hypothetical protein [Streptomyces sp. NRRL B-3229]|uniref:hypothetical protein n=1 Tax=Streptomyces sp. NRRL B-3229 TaxID=1463836 RepID=UPI0004C175A6|nr:hypothetical protein [Streptomyces sp. NRRL B-3229]